MKNPRFKNERLQQKYEEAVKSSLSMWRSSVRSARENAECFEPAISLIDPEFPDWFFSAHSPKLFVRVPAGGRAEFSGAVSRLAKLLGETPDVSVRQGEFAADFTENKVHLYLSNPNDCKLIEVEEIRKVLKPHPECVAALKELEDAI